MELCRACSATGTQVTLSCSGEIYIVRVRGDKVTVKRGPSRSRVFGCDVSVTVVKASDLVELLKSGFTVEEALRYSQLDDELLRLIAVLS